MGGGSRDSDWSKDSYRNRDSERRSYRSYSNNHRSSDYRNEDSYSKDDYEHSERKYRNEHRNKEHRDRRSRSRSSERDNRNYDYDCGKNYDKFEEKDRSKKESPNNTLMIRNLPFNITDKEISTEINKYGLYPKDVRLMKNKETGKSRGFAFIEFSSVDQAIQLKEMTKNNIIIADEYECSLHYSFPKENPAVVDKNALKTDWCCPKCGINNFKRRDECFKCGTSKEDLRGYENGIEVIQQPSNVLLLRNLSPQTTEERVLTIIGTLTSLPIKSIRIAQDIQYPQTNMCSLELHSVYEANDLFYIISSMTNGFVIDDNLVTLSYGRVENATASNVSTASQNAALAALAAAQWKNLDESSTSSSSKKKSKSLGTVTVNGVEYTKYNPPVYNTFQYDGISGFYYDPATGFYYDSNSRYFFNSSTQKYMYYDSTNQIYITVDSDGKATNDSTAAAKSDDGGKRPLEELGKTDKVKMAKKIAKDMEKWAKTLNQKKESIKATAVMQQQQEMAVSPVDSDEQSTADAAYYLLEKQIANPQEMAPPTSKVCTADPFEIIKAEEEKLIDRKRLACLLCKRQFNSVDLLNKHQQMSELHKTNLSTLRQSLLNEEQLEQMAKMENELAYRDRAKERREKYGFDDTPEYSKQKIEKSITTPVDAISAPELPITNDNIGSKMLKAMGWTEGTGLGKSNQGISNIVQVERRRSGLGLGASNATFTKESYKEAVRRTAMQRFNEMSNS